jgi:hypothetical protein
MKKVFVVFMLATFFIAYSANSQSLGRSYKTALGAKVWDGFGVSLKSFVNGNNALEGIGYFGKNGTRITGLYEIHGDLGDAPGLKWYIGPGAHLGFYNAKHGGGTVAGIDGVIGIDLKVNRTPINFSIDWQPSFEFGENSTGFIGSWGGLGIRYTF